MTSKENQVAATAEDDTTTTAQQEGTMLAFAIATIGGDKTGRVVRVPIPVPEPGFALIRVLLAGVCNTDLEILQGYMVGFTGVLGHEFVGRVVQVNSEDSETVHEWMGKRVCGDINVGCAACDICRCDTADDYGENARHCPNMARNHCPNRTVLGILNRNGTMAEYLTLPIRNLHVVPDHVSDEVAVFAEPLAAACRIVEQKLVNYNTTSHPPDRVAILGDGKLGLMIAEVLGREHTRHFVGGKTSLDDNYNEMALPPKPILFGKHKHKLELVAESGVEGRFVSEAIDASTFSGVSKAHAGQYDVVVDATGSPSGLKLAAGMCRPMGTVILKSTCAAKEPFHAAPIVIDELKVVGSRCGPIDKALELLSIRDDENQETTTTSTATTTTTAIAPPLHVEKYITRTFPLAQAAEAIQCAAQKSTMKVQIKCCSSAI